MPGPELRLPPVSLDDNEFLEGDEVILAVDDYHAVVVLLQNFLHQRGLKTLTASSVQEFRQVLHSVPIALILLDINLPDGDGTELISEIKEASPSTAIIMLSAATDLHTALECLRHGADDYLTKPVQLATFWETVRKVLEKRRLQINNRRYQQQLEQAHFRIQLLHELALKMNTAYLGMTALEEILQAILVGITAEEGLKFNRAFLALFDSTGTVLEGRLAVGPGCREDAVRIWQEMSNRALRFHDIIDSIKGHDFHEDSEVNKIVRALRIPADNREHLLIRAAMERKTINVCHGQCEFSVPVDLMGLLQEDNFVVVPLYSSTRSLGVIIADHFVTGKEIDSPLIRALESFASQASLAIEHCRLYADMEEKIKQLELVTHELETNKDLLVESERYSVLGQVAAQLAHNIRNPITSIGGTARLLSRKTSDPQQLKFLDMMAMEVTRIEQTLEDLFNFVDISPLKKESVLVYPLIIKTLMLFYNAMEKQGIKYQALAPEQLTCELDARQIRKVLVHLVRNAVEAMENGGTLEIEVSTDRKYIHIAVKDSGMGIAAADLQRVSDPFYTTKVAGTGVGLALVERIIKDHQGKLHIQCREHGGTEVIITLPNP
ncbi:MAG: response regulator [Candidatus Electrothrix aestuarii]|uniref:histidine kinase n=1 Tax=Candidatus Electrothrix aestuarii TaxID=3062594 RepID=A0AAU8M1C6_9BACT|nr:response regulator [Candidatus Electrothrix aestuarii]